MRRSAGLLAVAMVCCHGATVPELDEPAVAIAFAPAACDTCVRTKCVAQNVACAKDETCLHFESCLGACAGDPACRSRCTIKSLWPNDAQIDALDACLASSCADACNVVCGGFGSVADPDHAGTCQECALAHFCDVAAACATDPGCVGAERCRQGARIADVSQACAPADETSNNAYSALTSARTSSCLPECGFGRNWTCVGAVTWPKAAVDFVHVNITVQTFPQQTGIPGVTIRECAIGLTCDEGAKGQTDGDGKTSLDVRTHGVGKNGFDGYFDVQGTNIYPTIVYEPPLTQAAVTYLTYAESPSNVALIAALAHVTLDDGRGQIVIQAQDCNLANAPDVSFELSNADDATTPFYTVGPSIVKGPGTDASGVGGFLNAQKGLVTVTMRQTSTGDFLAKRGVSVLPKTATLVLLSPSP